eukprot:3590955-Rhodomonas_salina.1
MYREKDRIPEDTLRLPGCKSRRLRLEVGTVTPWQPWRPQATVQLKYSKSVSSLSTGASRS